MINSPEFYLKGNYQTCVSSLCIDLNCKNGYLKAGQRGGTRQFQMIFCHKIKNAEKQNYKGKVGNVTLFRHQDLKEINKTYLICS